MYAAVLYGFLGLDFDIIPDFENEILEGEVYLKGAVQLFGIVVIALRVYTNELFKKINFKEKLIFYQSWIIVKIKEDIMAENKNNFDATVASLFKGMGFICISQDGSG